MKEYYRIVRTHSLTHLEELVNQGMAEGWAPVGGPFRNQTSRETAEWCQAMVRSGGGQ